MVFVDRGRRRTFLGDVGVFVRRRWRGKWWRRIQEGAGVPEVPEVPVQDYPPDEPNHVRIESPPSTHPAKRVYDITGYEAPYLEPRTKLQYANTDVFKTIRSFPSEYVQSYLALTNVAVVLRVTARLRDSRGWSRG